MSSTSRRGDEDSRGSEPSDPVRGPVADGSSEPVEAGAGGPEGGPAEAPRSVAERLLLGLVAAGIAALVAATFLPVLRISVNERVVTALDRTGWDEHGAALLALAAFAALMLAALLRGDGGVAPALAIALCGLAVIAVVAASDLPDVGDVGAVGTRLQSGKVGTGLGAYAEALGGVLLLAGGGGLALRGRRG